MTSTLQIRPPQLRDLEAVAELLNEHSRRLYGVVDDMTVEELRTFWDSDDVDLGHDVLLAERGTDLIGYADLWKRSGGVWIDLRTLDEAAIEPLLEMTEERAAQIARELPVRASSDEGDTAVRQALEAAGYRLFRHSFRMVIDLEGELPEPDWPDGIAVRTFREGDERRVYETHMESFADTWAFTRDSYEQWARYFLESSDFDPELWFLAEAGDELAGIALTRASETEPEQGWIRILGVVPAYRRRGLGDALLRHVFHEFSRRGCERVGLGVDAENPTGAVRLYERAGMRVARRRPQYEKVRG